LNPIFVPQARTFQGSLEQLAPIRDFVQESVRECGGSPDDAFACELATDEAAANVFNHAFPDKYGQLELTTQCTLTALVIRLRYRGSAFDPSAVPEPDLTKPLEQRPIGGLGLYFMRQVMDQVTFEFDAEQGNTLTMRRLLNLPERYGTMELSVEQPRADVSLIHVQGSVDGSNFRRLIDQAQQLYDAGQRRIILELSGCEYMSSSGLVALNAITKLLRGEQTPETENGWALLKTLDDMEGMPQSQQLALVAPTKRVDRVLDMAGMKTYLPIYPDTAAALAALNV